MSAKHQPKVLARRQVYIAVVALLCGALLLGFRLFLFEPVRVATKAYEPLYPKGSWVLIRKGVPSELHQGDVVLFRPIPDRPAVLGVVCSVRETDPKQELQYYGIWPGVMTKMPKNIDSLWWCTASAVSGRAIAHLEMPF